MRAEATTHVQQLVGRVSGCCCCQVRSCVANSTRSFLPSLSLSLVLPTTLPPKTTTHCNRDTAVLCESLTYNTGLPEVLTGQAIHDHVRAYRPPFEEFEIQRIEVPAGETVTIPTNQGPLLLLVHAGSGSAAAQPPTSSSSAVQDAALQKQLELHRGSVTFVPAETGLSFTASATGPLSIWAAAVNAAVFAVPAAEPAVEEPVPAEKVLVAA